MKLHFMHNPGMAETTSSRLLGKMPGRKFLSIQNQHATAIVYIRFDAPAKADESSLKIPPGALYEMRDPCAGEEVNIIATVACKVNVIEGVSFENHEEI